MVVQVTRPDVVSRLPGQRHRPSPEGDAGDEQVMALLQQHAVKHQVDPLVGDASEGGAQWGGNGSPE